MSPFAVESEQNSIEAAASHGVSTGVSDIATSPAMSRRIESLDFASLVEFARRAKAKEQLNYTTQAELYAAFMAILPSVQIVSFDIFDTALLRYVDHPTDVFFHLEEMPAFAAHSFSQPVSKLRIAAEKAARSLVSTMIGTGEVNLLEIYQVFCDLNGISRDFASGFAAAEEQVELRLCVACAAIRRLYVEAVTAGKQVIFVSDTYHSTEFLSQLLVNSGYEVDISSIFASSAARKAKQSGDLFPLVLAQIGVEPGAVLHLGDHPVSDHEQARSAGLRSILHSQKTSREVPELHELEGGPKQKGDDARLAQKSIVRGMRYMTAQAAVALGHGNDFWWKFGYSSVGPLTVGFCQWLEESLRTDGMQHAYFLLRDGELFFQVYECLFHDKPDACPASRLDSSRRAMLLPALEVAPAFALPSLLGGIGLRPVREYLDRLGIEADGFESEAVEAGFDSLDDLIDGRIETNRLVNFLVKPAILTELLNRGRAERETLAAFVDEQKVTRSGKVALVDLGWSGTIHKCLQVLFLKIAPATKLTGYYMATFPEAPHTVIHGLALRSYLAHRGEPDQVYGQILSFLNLFETVYSSAAGSLLYFDKYSDAASLHVTPVRQASDKSPEQCNQLKAIHESALAFAENFKRLASPCFSFSLPPAFASEEFFRVISRPTAEEAHQLGGLVHCDNLGSTSTHVSARLRSTDDPAELLQDFRAVHWKQGALNLPTPEVAALRTLLWLMETQNN